MPAGGTRTHTHTCIHTTTHTLTMQAQFFTNPRLIFSLLLYVSLSGWMALLFVQVPFVAGQVADSCPMQEDYAYKHTHALILLAL